MFICRRRAVDVSNSVQIGILCRVWQPGDQGSEPTNKTDGLSRERRAIKAASKDGEVKTRREGSESWRVRLLGCIFTPGVCNRVSLATEYFLWSPRDAILRSYQPWWDVCRRAGFWCGWGSPIVRLRRGKRAVLANGVLQVARDGESAAQDGLVVRSE